MTGPNKTFSLYSIIPYKDSFLYYSKPRCAYLFYKNRRVNLLTGENQSCGLSELLDKLKQREQEDHLIFHAFYELGFEFVYGEIVDEDTPLGIWIEYDCVRELPSLGKSQNIGLEKWESVSFSDYHSQFNKGLEHLKRGDCYQYNLTFPFKAGHSAKGIDFAQLVWRDEVSRGAYGNFTYCEYLQQSYFSNSPECLFQINGEKIQSMPIKGTIACSEGEEKEKIKELNKSLKDESELFMITDLIRNDLNRLSNYSAKVLDKKSYLRVPKLLHSYSLIEANYKDETLFNLMKALFPGGSITGAPKKKVMEIIDNLEKSKRGFYCGSTIIKSGDLFAASINIRSMVIDEKGQSVLYHAGGGITFDSDALSEFEEMHLKHNSFISLLS